jgi:hypothetical protein
VLFCGLSNFLWLYGGINPSNKYAQDVFWVFRENTNSWKFLPGPENITHTLYGVQGSPTDNAFPGKRAFASGVVDKENRFWLFGGRDDWTDYNDVWVYQESWIYVLGDKKNGPIVQPAQGTNNAFPFPRFDAAFLKDSKGYLWIFGGVTSRADFLNDLWKCDPHSFTCQLQSGSTTPNQSTSLTIPGCRSGSFVGISRSDQIFLFAGEGFADNHFGYLDEVWVIQVKDPPKRLLSPGGIAGVVIACCAVFVLTLTIPLVILHKKKKFWWRGILQKNNKPNVL